MSEKKTIETRQRSIRIEVSVPREKKMEEEFWPEGTRFLDIAQAHQEEYDSPIVLVKADGRLRELNRMVRENERVRFVTLCEKAGRDTWRRSLVLLMLKAVSHTAEKEGGAARVSLHFSAGNSYYCTMTGDIPLTQEFLDRTSAYMHSLVRCAAPIEKIRIPVYQARERFHEFGMYDKEELFFYRRASTVNLYRLENFEDYFYGYMLPDTSLLDGFGLKLFEDGFLLLFPPAGEAFACGRKETPAGKAAGPASSALQEAGGSRKVWQVQKASLEWGRGIGIPTIGALNSFLVHRDAKDLILIQEAYHEKNIAGLAGEIAASGRRVVLIAGPSSSGKTTFSHRLAVQLSVCGLKPHAIEADNYFVEREKTPLDAEGKPDFERMEAIDLEKLNEDMAALLAGETVELPVFNFKTGKREYRGRKETLGEKDILIIEGIHCLNDRLTYRLDPKCKFKIYISALTQLNVDEHNRVPTTDGRLLRRIVRDARIRGTDARRTVAMWPSVRRGEENYIFPYQESADALFNSTLIYELGVLKQYAEPLLFSVTPEHEGYEEAKRLLKFLDYVLPIPSDAIPNNSLIREFIGGGCFGC